jgi:hypothetical protein
MCGAYLLLFISWQPRMSLRYSGRPGNKRSASSYTGNVYIEQAIQAIQAMRRLERMDHLHAVAHPVLEPL